jgi:hypothetical protein
VLLPSLAALSTLVLQVADGALVAASAVPGGSAGLDAVSAVITAHEASAVKLLEDLKVVVEANQARRKPKVQSLGCHRTLYGWPVFCYSTQYLKISGNAAISPLVCHSPSAVCAAVYA